MVSKTETRRGILLIFSSPSGAGKTTLCRALLENNSNISVSVSCTTRPPRAGERDGVDYHFVSQETFDVYISQDAFIEHATVFGNSYGSLHQEVEDKLARGMDVLFDVDWQGAQAIQQAGRDDVVSVFILPPSVEALEHRLRQRGLDGQDIIETRMKKAVSEMSHWDAYQYVIINRDIDESVANVQSILQAERLKRHRQHGLTGFIRNLGVEA